MELTFLGSAAAEGIPFPYCECTTCNHARKYRGKNIRKRCSYLINGEFLVDAGPDLFISCALHDVNLLNVRYVAITHSHLDHFLTQNFELRAKHFRLETDLPQLNVIGGPSTMTMLNKTGSKDINMGIKKVPILPYETVDLPPYYLKTIKAAHFPSVGDAMNFIIHDKDAKIMIASDTGVYNDDVWSHLHNINLDMIIIEVTKGDLPSNSVHLNIKDATMLLEKMKKVGAISNNTLIYATHFGHQHCPPHEELSSKLFSKGIICAFDGMTVTI